MNKLKISEVMHDFVIVKPILPEEQKTESGLVVASLKAPQFDKGEVVGAGPGRREGTELIQNPFKVGEKVIFHRSAFYEIEEDGERLFVMKPHDIFGKLS